MANTEMNMLDVPDEDRLVLVDTEDELAVEESKAEEPKAEEPKAEEPKAEEPKAEEPKAEEPPPRRHKKTRDDRIAELTYRYKSEQEQRVAAETRLEMRERELLAQQAKFLKEREEELTKIKDEAIKSGDMESYDDVNTKLDNLRKMEGYGAPTEIPERPEIPEQPGRPPDLAPAAAAWIEDNDWFKDPDNAELAQKAIRIEEELAQQYGRGFRLYRKLDDILEQDPDFAHVYGVEPKHDTDLAGDDRQGQGVVAPSEQEHGEKPRAQTRPVRGGDRGETPPATPDTGKDKNGLTDHDKAVMRRFNLDPSDPQVRAAYLKRKGK